MAAGDVAGDGEAEARTTGIQIARLVESHEGLEHFLAHVGRHARTVVVDEDAQPAARMGGGDAHVAA